MTRPSIDIPDELRRRKMESRVAETGHGSLERYLDCFVREDAASIDYGAPDDVKVRTRQELGARVREALASPSREMTASDWDHLRRQSIDRHCSEAR